MSTMAHWVAGYVTGAMGGTLLGVTLERWLGSRRRAGIGRRR